MIALEILKWIGIVLGCVVGGVLALVLLLLVVLLFVPFRYEARLVHEDMDSSLLYSFRVSWLLRAVSFKKKLNEKKMVLRVFGIPVKRMGGDETAKNSGIDVKEEPSVISDEIETIHEHVVTPSHTDADTDVDARREEEKQARREEKEAQREEKEEVKAERQAQKEEKKAIREEKKATRVEREKKKVEPEREPTFFEKIQIKIRAKIQEIKNKIIGIKDKISFIFQKISSIIDFVREKATRRTVAKLLKEVVNLIKYIGPQKLKGSFRFGTGDPSSTGMLLGGLSLLPVVYQKGVAVSPDFEEKCFIGDGTLTGRIRLVYLVRLVLRLIFDKEVRWVYKQWKQISG